MPHANICLRTKRLELRPMNERDWPFFRALQTDCDVMRYVADARLDSDIRARFEARLPAWTASCAHWLCLAVRTLETHELLGVTDLCRTAPGSEDAEVGYLFMPASQGRGYATESLLAVIDFAQASGFAGLSAVVTSGNVASQRVLEKAGFRQTRVESNAIQLAGVWHDDLHYHLDMAVR